MKLWAPFLALLGLGLSPVARANGLADTIDLLPDCAVCEALGRVTVYKGANGYR